jgi:hypothetical protein
VKRFLLLPIIAVPMVFVSVAIGASWITTCGFSHTNSDDPIVFPGAVGASHNHTYVGARTTNAFSTPSSMRAGGTSCRTQGDFAGYWVPTANYPVHSNKGFLAYYTVSQSTPPFPDGLKMIVRVGNGRILWKCGPGSGAETVNPPASCDSGMLVAVVEFPSWWDGRLDSSDHISHMSYSKTSTHTVQLPRIKVYARYAVPAGAPINVQLSSGSPSTMHMDFFNAWDRAALQALITRCGGGNCGTDPQ